MRKIMLDFNGLNSREEVQEYLAQQMKFPVYYGKNLDALYDCLTDINRPTAIVCNVPEVQKDSYMENYLSRLYQTFQDAETDNRNLAVFLEKFSYKDT